MVVCFNVQKNKLIATDLLRVFLNVTGFKTVAVCDGEEYDVVYWSTRSGREAILHLCHDANSSPTIALGPFTHLTIQRKRQRLSSHYDENGFGIMKGL